jgi:excisionase family DNA binding protein
MSSIDEVIREAVQVAVKEAMKDYRSPVINSEQDDLLSITRAAELADVSTSTIKRWMDEGLLKRHGRGRVVRVRRSEVMGIRPQDERRTREDRVAKHLGRGG